MMQQPLAVQHSRRESVAVVAQPSPASISALRTPITSTGFGDLRCKVGNNLDVLDNEPKLHLQKLWKAAEKVYADRAILSDEDKLSLEQNTEKTVLEVSWTTVGGRPKLMCHRDILKAQRKRSKKTAGRMLQDRTMHSFTVPTASMLSETEEQMLESRRQIEAMSLTQFCQFLNLALLSRRRKILCLASLRHHHHHRRRRRRRLQISLMLTHYHEYAHHLITCAAMTFRNLLGPKTSPSNSRGIMLRPPSRLHAANQMRQ